jgi:intracellular sulfur oxidation DsrE/DsrF family protein
MKIERPYWFAAVLLCLGLAAAVPAQQPAPAKHRIVVAITSGDEADWHLTVGNLRHLAETLPDAEIEVVAYGPGLSMVLKTTSTVAKEMQDLAAKHVRFVACENSMRGRNVTVADLLAGVGTVPSGIVEVVTKQEQGWVYIKAGR